MSSKPVRLISVAAWRDTAQVCIYSDSERHLGHIVRSSVGWIAFDGMHTDAAGKTFRPLGFFHSRVAAKEAVQSATTSFSFDETVI